MKHLIQKWREQATALRSQNDSSLWSSVAQCLEDCAKELESMDGERGMRTGALSFQQMADIIHNSVDSDTIAASCNCGTKTPEIKHHAKGCKYRLVVERDEAVDLLRRIGTKGAFMDLEGLRITASDFVARRYPMESETAPKFEREVMSLPGYQTRCKCCRSRYATESNGLCGVCEKFRISDVESLK